MNSRFIKILMGILFFFILLVIVVNFFSNNKFNINYEIIICFSLLILLTLSERFDNIDIGKIIKVSKNIKDDNLKIENKVLTINNNQNILINFDKNKIRDNLEEKIFQSVVIIDNKSIKIFKFEDNNTKSFNDFITDEIDYLIALCLIYSKYEIKNFNSFLK